MADVAVTIEPLGVTIAVRPGETLMAAAQRQGLKWPTLCRGNAQCGYCFVRVREGAVGLPPPTEREMRAIGLAPLAQTDETVRLACQLAPAADLVVERRGVAALADPGAAGQVRGGIAR